jgi:hypothetical protein
VPRFLFQIKFQQYCVRDAVPDLFCLAGTRSLSALCFLFLKYIAFVLGCRNIWSGLNLQLVLAPAPEDSFCYSLLHLNGESLLESAKVCGEWSTKLLFCFRNNCSKLFVVVHNCGLTPTCAYSRDKRSNLFSGKFALVTGRHFKMGAGAIFSTLLVRKREIVL